MKNKLISLHNHTTNFLGDKKVKAVMHDPFTLFLNNMHSSESQELIKRMSEMDIPVSVQIVALVSKYRTMHEDRYLYKTDPEIEAVEDRLAYAEWLQKELPQVRWGDKAMDMAVSFVFNKSHISDGKQIYRENVLLRNYYMAKYRINEFEYGQVSLFSDRTNNISLDRVSEVKFLNSLERLRDDNRSQYLPGRSINLAGRKYRHVGIETAYKIDTDNGVVWGTHELFKSLRVKADAKIISQIEMCVLKGDLGDVRIPLAIVQKYNEPDKMDIQYTKKLIRENDRENKALRFAMKMARLRYGRKVKPIIGSNGQPYLMLMPNIGIPSDPLQPDGANRRDDNIYKDIFKRLKQEERVKILTDKVLTDNGIEVPLVSISITGTLELRDHHRIWGANDARLPIYVRVAINHPSLN